MLVLSRRIGQKIVFPAIESTIQIVSVKPGVVRIGIDAPDNIAVYREELLQRSDFQAEEKPTAQTLSAGNVDELIHLLNNRLNASTIGLALLRRQLELGMTGEMRNTLDKIESNMTQIQQRVERLDAEKPRPARSVKRRALVVEDDRNECELLAGFLRLAGMDVHTAGDGAAALDYLNHEDKPDVVLLDMILPRCDGPTTVRTIRRNPAHADLRIIGVTGGSVEQFGLDEGPSGINRWFRKPINPDVLLRELAQEFDAETTKS
jgi:carbon storage regulator CsrA